MDTDLIRAFSYAKGWRVERIMRVLYPDLKYQCKEYLNERKKMVDIITDTEKKLNAKQIHLIDILDVSDLVLKKFYLEHGTINLSKIEN